MFCRKSLLRLLFAGVALLFARGAVALPLPDPPYESGTTSTSSWGGTWNSTISCTAISGVNVVDFTSLTQSAVVQCTVSTVPTPAICQLDISYSRAAGLTTSGATQCQPSADNTTSTLTDVAYCGNASNGLVVSGTLNCNPQNASPPPAICGGNDPCIANLDGIAGVPNGQCSTVFPATADLAAGQVLKASVTTTGPSCTGTVTAYGTILTRFCNSGSFNPADPSLCVFGTGSNRQVAQISGTTTVFVPVQVQVSPETINVSCSPNKDNGNVSFTIFGDASVNVSLINPASLKLEGVSATCSAPSDSNSDGFLDLSCTVPSCPDLGPILASIRNADGTVVVEVTGSLLSGTAIQGEDAVKTSPKP